MSAPFSVCVETFRSRTTCRVEIQIFCASNVGCGPQLPTTCGIDLSDFPRHRKLGHSSFKTVMTEFAFYDP